MVVPDAAADLHAIELRHHVVEQGDLRTVELCEFKGFGSITGLNDLDVVELHNQETADVRLVVRD